jgi:DNA polymerase-3 subunit delta'
MTFRDILGQDRAVSRLRQAWTAGRLPQAYCFAGPPGVGKRTTAMALAQAVNCASPLAPGGETAARDACGSCLACRKVAAGIHPDVHQVRPETKAVITIDQVREVAAQAALRAYEGKAKVWILDPADLMQEPAANALLKTLEEPAGTSLFILVTTAPTALLPTIRSRCQHLQFEGLREDHLRQILTRQGRSPEDAAAAAALAAGSAERALALEVSQATVARDRIVQGVWGALSVAGLPALLDQAELLAKDRAGLERALEVLVSFSRDLAVTKVGGDAASLVHADRPADLAKLAAAYPVGVILAVYQAQVEAQRSLSRYANPRMTAERMLLKMRQATGGGEGDRHGRHCED